MIGDTKKHNLIRIINGSRIRETGQRGCLILPTGYRMGNCLRFPTGYSRPDRGYWMGSRSKVVRKSSIRGNKLPYPR